MIKLVIGDLIQCKSDVIVAPIKNDMVLEGSISGNIKEKFSKEAEIQLKFYKEPRLTQCVPLFTYGKIPAKVILLVFNPWWNKDQHAETLKELKQSYLNCLEFAFANKYKSITFPALSTGKFYNVPLAKSITCFSDACKEFEDKHGKNLDINFCVLDEVFKKNHTVLTDCLGEPFNDKTDKGHSSYEKLPSNRARDFSKRKLPKKYLESFSDILDELMHKYCVSSKEALRKNVCTIATLNKYLAGTMTPKSRDIVLALAFNMGASVDDANKMLISFTKLDERNGVRDSKIIYGLQERECDLKTINEILIKDGLEPLTK